MEATQDLLNPMIQGIDKAMAIGTKYIFYLVFLNPSQLENRMTLRRNKKAYSYGEAYDMFRTVIRSEFDTELFAEYSSKIDGLFADASGEIPTEKLLMLLLRAVLTSIQEQLMMSVDFSISRDGMYIYVGLAASEENLKIQADMDSYKLKVDMYLDSSKDYEKVAPFAKFKFEGDSNECSIPFRRYNMIGDRDQNGDTIFREVDRLRLINQMLMKAIDMPYLSDLSLLVKVLPIHNTYYNTNLQRTWPNFKYVCKRQPLKEIRNYYGEKIAIYFAWLEFYAIWFTIPSIVGIGLGVLFFITNAHSDLANTDPEMSFKEISLLVFALFMPISTTMLDQLWIRRQHYLAWKWGMTDIETSEEQRAEYRGEYKMDEVSRKIKKVAPDNKWIRIKKIMNYWIILMFILVTIAILVALFWYRSTLDQLGYGPRIVGFVTAFQIKILNFIYRYIATWVTKYENLETNTEYYNSLTVKIFLFQFINSYASLFYIAFAQGYIEGCDEDNDCLRLLGVQLGSIFAMNLCFNLIEIGFPFLMNKWRLYKARKKMMRAGYKDQLKPEEEQHSMNSYETPLDDYMEVVISYGYVALFGVSLPFTPILALILAIVELRVDAWKLCNVVSRPYPMIARDIGVWMPILQSLAIMGCITSPAIILFTTDVFDFPEDQTNWKWIWFLIIEHLLIAFKILVSVIIPDVPTVVKKGIEWSNRVVEDRDFIQSPTDSHVTKPQIPHLQGQHQDKVDTLTIYARKSVIND